jgi:hypothetical protein
MNLRFGQENSLNDGCEGYLEDTISGELLFKFEKTNTIPCSGKIREIFMPEIFRTHPPNLKFEVF